MNYRKGFGIRILWISPNKQNTPDSTLRFVLVETEEDYKPFRYSRTFGSIAAERPVMDMEKDALQNYINKILGAKDARVNSVDPIVK